MGLEERMRVELISSFDCAGTFPGAQAPPLRSTILGPPVAVRRQRPGAVVPPPTWPRPRRSKSSIAKILNVSRSALYHFIQTRKIAPG